MWQQFWHDAIRNLGPVYFVLGIGFVVITIVRKCLETRKPTRVTYMLSDGGLNSVRVTFDVQINEATRRQVLSDYGVILSTYAPAFDPNSASSAQPVRSTQ